MDSDDSREFLCDEVVPSQALELNRIRLMKAIRTQDQWDLIDSATKKKQNRFGYPTMRFLWRSRSNAEVHLLYLSYEGVNIMAIEDASTELSLIVGVINRHPFICAPEFGYDNSNG